LHPLIEKARREDRHLLEPEALGLLEEYGIVVPRHVAVHSEQEALAAARDLGFPVTMKIVSRHILHKTESGGVALDLRDEDGVKEAFSRLASVGGGEKKGDGFILYPFQAHEVELAMGMVRDAQFGPVMTFGLGGIWIEALRDLAYGIAPLSPEEAEEMLRSIRGRSLLEGLRGREPADRRALCEVLVRLSRMALEETAIREIDLNPVFPLSKGCFIADVRVVIR